MRMSDPLFNSQGKRLKDIKTDCFLFIKLREVLDKLKQEECWGG